MSLKRYWKKRDFTRTSEPRGKREVTPVSSRSFVIQKHAASRLHYDFRLELDGTLKSWAVPKGPSLDPKQKRLAVHVEDHPLEYAGFEGIIPPKQYGAGTVLVWDRGIWTPDGDPQASYRRGHLKFSLEGSRLHGRWTLVRMEGRSENGKENWLLIKERDEAARAGTAAEITGRATTSVASGKELEEIAASRPRVWRSEKSRAGNGQTRTVAHPSVVGRAPGARKASIPEWIRPQLATLVESAPEGDEWIHELKYDGYRMLCRIKDGKASLFSRNGREWTKKLMAQATAAAALPVKQAWMDGEVVALRLDGTISFQALQNALDGISNDRVLYYLFDLLYLDGYDLRAAPLSERKKRLAEILAGRSGDGILRYSDHITGGGQVVFEQACRQGLEGLIAKRAKAPYFSGRNRNWVKVKCQHRQEFVIGGFSDPEGSRRWFGALLLGVYEKPGRLKFVGRVGTGFSEQRLTELYRILRKLESRHPPFVDPPRGYDAKGVHWVKPELVAEVRFSEWTHEGILRHPAFLGLRPDKPAHAVVEEYPEETPKKGNRHERSKPPRRKRGSRKSVEATQAPDLAGITLSNPGRMLYPEVGVTKLDLARYYEQVAEWILPHLRGRPLTLVRCPEGHTAGCFYQKHVTEQVSEVIGRVEVEEEGGRAWYMTAETPAAVVALVQLGVLELHTWGARRDRLDRPDRMILDLDPDPQLPWRDVVNAAQLSRGLLDELGLASFVKTTGGKGLHIVVPLERRHTWDQVKGFAKGLADHMVRTIPAKFTANMAKRIRMNKIFIDYLRNTKGATAVAAYSTRATPRATVSVPLAWDELSTDTRSDHFTLRNIAERLKHLRADPWADYWRTSQHLTEHMAASLGTTLR